MDSDRIYFRAATQADYDAIHLLAKEFNCSASQIVDLLFMSGLVTNL